MAATPTQFFRHHEANFGEWSKTRRDGTTDNHEGYNPRLTRAIFSKFPRWNLANASRPSSPDPHSHFQSHRFMRVRSGTDICHIRQFEWNIFWRLVEYSCMRVSGCGNEWNITRWQQLHQNNIRGGMHNERWWGSVGSQVWDNLSGSVETTANTVFKLGTWDLAERSG